MVKKKEKEFRPLCPFCSAPWTDDMVKVEDTYASRGCDTCGYGAEITGTVTIKCSSCNRVIYQKEFSDAH